MMRGGKEGIVDASEVSTVLGLRIVKGHSVDISLSSSGTEILWLEILRHYYSR